MANVEVGVDLSEIIRRFAKRIHDEGTAQEQKRKEQEQLWKYETRESYVVLVTVISEDKESVQKVYRARTVTEVPGAGHVEGTGHSPDSAIVDLRYQLAQAYMGSRLVKDYDEARERAAKVELIRELFV